MAWTIAVTLIVALPRPTNWIVPSVTSSLLEISETDGGLYVRWMYAGTMVTGTTSLTEPP